jgi:hypothetical protein
MLGLFLSRNGQVRTYSTPRNQADIYADRPTQRNVIPALMYVGCMAFQCNLHNDPSIVITGRAFGGHAQALMFSTMVHSIFGYTLAVAGIARIIEVCFVAHTGHDSEPLGR